MYGRGRGESRKEGSRRSVATAAVKFRLPAPADSPDLPLQRCAICLATTLPALLQKQASRRGSPLPRSTTRCFSASSASRIALVGPLAATMTMMPLAIVAGLILLPCRRFGLQLLRGQLSRAIRVQHVEQGERRCGVLVEIEAPAVLEVDQGRGGRGIVP